MFWQHGGSTRLELQGQNPKSIIESDQDFIYHVIDCKGNIKDYLT
jgi:hypothetical protein